MNNQGQLTFGIIGCGHVVSNIHVPVWKKIDDVNCKAVCDRDRTSAKNIQKRLSADRLYESVDEFLKNEYRLNFVVVSTPGPTHVRISKRILKRGMNVICEKPIAYSINDIEELKNLSMKYNCEFCCIHNYREKSNTREAISLFGDNGDDKVDHINFRWRGIPLENQYSEWLKNERDNKLILFDFAYHFIDIICKLMAETPKIEYTSIETCNHYTQSITTYLRSNGLTATLDLQLEAETAFSQLEILGDDNTAHLEYYPDGYRKLPTIDTPIHRGYGDLQRMVFYAFRESLYKLGLGLKQNMMGHYRIFNQFVLFLQGDNPNPMGISDIETTIELLENLAKSVY